MHHPCRMLRNLGWGRNRGRCLGLLTANDDGAIISDFGIYALESTVVREMQRDNRVMQYLRETRAELRKVVWPTREEAINLTGIVVGTIIAMSAFMGFFDYIFTALFRFLIAPR